MPTTKAARGPPLCPPAQRRELRAAGETLLRFPRRRGDRWTALDLAGPEGRTHRPGRVQPADGRSLAADPDAVRLAHRPADLEHRRDRAADPPSGRRNRCDDRPISAGSRDAHACLPPPLLDRQPIRELLDLGAASTRRRGPPGARRRGGRAAAAGRCHGKTPALGPSPGAGALGRRSLRRPARSAARCARAPPPGRGRRPRTLER